MKLTSSSFNDGSQLPPSYTCDGKGVHPPLTIEDAPEGVRSFVLIMEDVTIICVHWTLWGIPSDTIDISEGKTPPMSKEGLNDFGGYSYHSPCPASGVHRYQFRLFALRDILELPEHTNRDTLIHAMEDKILEVATLNCTYTRS